MFYLNGASIALEFNQSTNHPIRWSDWPNAVFADFVHSFAVVMFPLLAQGNCGYKGSSNHRNVMNCKTSQIISSCASQLLGIRVSMTQPQICQQLQHLLSA